MSARVQPSGASARSELRTFLAAIAGPPSIGGYFEIRERHGQEMRCRFHLVNRTDQAADAILDAADDCDVYVGAALRARRSGGRTSIRALTSLWVDADTEDSIGRLTLFRPQPSIVIASGRGRHAYWLLDEPMAPDVGEDVNRRLALHLAADVSCSDAARILRPPHTLNHGYEPARPVRPVRLDTRRWALAAIVQALPPQALRPARDPDRVGRRAVSADPLLELEPAVYVTALLGLRVGRDRKVSCPFHTDQHPSLHVYPSAAEGWHCFSCGRGGSVYDLAAALWQLEPRGRSFLELRERLHELLLQRAS